MASNPDGELQTCISEQPAISSFISATSEFASRTAYVDNPSREGVLTDLSRLTIKYPAAITDFFGTPGSAPCVYKSGPAWPGFQGLEKRHIIREIRPVYSHPIADSWLKIGTGICDVLDSRGVSWTSIDPVAFANAGEAKPFCPLLMWIGVKHQSLVFDDAVIAANSIKDLLGSAGFPEIEVAFRESEVTYSASGPKLSPFDPVRDRVAEFRKPFTPVLGLPIAPLKKPHLEGTGALYFRLGKNDKRVALLTAAHVAHPPTTLPNNGLVHMRPSQRREEIVALGTKAYSDATNTMTAVIDSLLTDVVPAWEKKVATLDKSIKLDGGNAQDIVMRKENQDEVEKAKMQTKSLDELHSEVTKYRTNAEQRTIGFVLHSEPLVFSDGPRRFTRDWALIELYDNMIDWNTFLGNKVYIGKLAIHRSNIS